MPVESSRRPEKRRTGATTTSPMRGAGEVVEARLYGGDQSVGSMPLLENRYVLEACRVEQGTRTFDACRPHDDRCVRARSLAIQVHELFDRDTDHLGDDEIPEFWKGVERFPDDSAGIETRET